MTKTKLSDIFSLRMVKIFVRKNQLTTVIIACILTTCIGYLIVRSRYIHDPQDDPVHRFTIVDDGSDNDEKYAGNKATSKIHADKLILTTDTKFVSHIPGWTIVTLEPKLKCGMENSEKFKETVHQAVKDGVQFIFKSIEYQPKTLHYLDRFNYDKTMPVMKYMGNSTTPVKSHFIVINENYQKRNFAEMRYNVSVWRTAPIQKILLRNEINTGDIDDRAPPIAISIKNSRYTFVKDMILFRYDAFWAMVPFKDNELWSMWVQKLLLELKTWVTFTTVSPSQHLCSNNGKLSHNDLNHIASWKCKSRSNFFECVKDFNRFLVSNKFMDSTQEKTITKWLKMLTIAGYTQPSLNPNNDSTGLVYRAIFRPKSVDSLYSMKQSYHNICGKTQPACPFKTVKMSTKKFSTILLNVVFNHATFYKNTEYLANIYRPHFTHINFCGTKMDNFLPYNAKLDIPVSFIEMDDKEFQKGQFDHRCIEGAMKMNYDIDGVFHVNDDILLNLWNLPRIPTDRVWFQKDFLVVPFARARIPSVYWKWAEKDVAWWPWHNDNLGKIKLKGSIDTLRNLSKSEPLAAFYINQVDKNTGGKRDIGFAGNTDIAYFPKKTFKTYLYAAQVQSPFTIYLELAVPGLIAGVTNLHDVVTLPGKYIWFEERPFYAQHYNVSHVFLHPLKIGGCLPKKPCKQFLCEKYLSCL
ncbi:hypothetical protein LOTGIDRAFT_158872 [Lottia gigantea]|uniref:Uncharacterized protein n=1 Tax=Lottia gigantea TaxID=225164 RepID=V4AVB0_LOTGI|nr:hypothetical protein LOTGIDRAFT_158872 [Lottia gigantea]ESO98915.1 hypothetical protein LOTGIDRAFT_158872 [Lottia gigantea]